MEGLKDQNPMGEEVNFFLKVGKSKDYYIQRLGKILVLLKDMRYLLL